MNDEFLTINTTLFKISNNIDLFECFFFLFFCFVFFFMNKLLACI